MRSGSAARLDAVTVDAFGTLLVLEDPAPGLQVALAERGIDRARAAVRTAFAAEAAYYRPRSLTGRDGQSLARLRRDCVTVFLHHLDAELDAEEFASAFVAAIVFRQANGAGEALAALRAGGLSLACVANWDISLFGHLQRLQLGDHFDAVLTSAEAGAEKPDPRIFSLALDRLGVSATRALHIGDEVADREGAHAAGLVFAPVPLATLPERLGL